ncbi:MAG: ATP-binding protein, partial [Planctomycetota bacterium]|nr:ATP-binding protein [Planctomycetota bacterium]
MVKGRPQKLNHHVIRSTGPKGFHLLKIAALYGANASGKSNLVKAIATARKIILEPSSAKDRLPLEPFRLDTGSRQQPTKFEFEIKVGNKNFAYGFQATQTEITEEWLYELDRKKDVCVYERNITPEGPEFKFPGIRFARKEEEQFLRFTAKGTPRNRLFLQECRERNVRENVRNVDPIFQTLDWFENRLRVIFPDTKYAGLEFRIHEDEDFGVELAKFLSSFDTGIEKIELEEVDFDKELNEVPNEVKESILNDVDEGTVVVVATPGNIRYHISMAKAGNLKASRLVAKRKLTDCDERASFSMSQESDGTLRLLDLIPGLMSLLSEERVLVIDELDRSFHPELTLSYLKSFVDFSRGRESQLIFTTHETDIMSQEFLRRDEIWLVEKGRDHCSKVVALEE